MRKYNNYFDVFYVFSKLFTIFAIVFAAQVGFSARLKAMYN